MTILKRKLKRELGSISLNLDASLETAQAGLDQLRSKELLDIDKTAECLETLINSVARQNVRLLKAITR